VQQFDNIGELLGIMIALQQDDDLSIQIRQQMRRESMRLMLHNAGKHTFAHRARTQHRRMFYLHNRRCNALHGIGEKRF
jgi:hypothetical protein